MANLRKRYSKSLFGTNHQGYHSPEVAYATAADLGAFALAAVEGQVGIFNAADDTIRSTALTAGVQFYLAQIKDGEVRKTPVLTYGSGFLEVTKTAYDAPVKQVTHVGSNGTAGSLGFSSIAVGDEYVVSARDTTPGTQPFPVMEGRAVIRSLSNLTEYKIVRAIVDDLDNNFDYENNADNGFIVADIVNDATQVAIGAVTLAISKGSTLATYSAVHSLTAGDFVSILGVMYEVISVPTTSTAILDRPYTGDTETALATGATKASQQGTVTYVDGTTELGIRMTAVTEDTNFVVGVGDDLAGATITETTVWKQGSGAAWQVSAIEDESLVFDGFTTGNFPFVEDFGKPTKSVDPDSAVTYNLWFLRFNKTTPSMAYPNENAHHLGLVVISAPSTGTTPDAALDTVLGT